MFPSILENFSESQQISPLCLLIDLPLELEYILNYPLIAFTEKKGSIRNACFNLERLSRSFRLVRPGISPLEQLWNGFDSDAELFMYQA